MCKDDTSTSYRSLLLAMVAGDEEACREFVEYVWPKLTRTAQRFDNLPCEPDDVVSEVVAWAVVNARCLLAHKIGFLHQRVKWKCLEQLKRVARRPQVQPLLDDGEGTQCLPPNDPVEAREMVHHLLSQLKHDVREVIELKFFEDLTNMEVAARLGIARSTVERRYSRAMAQLTSCELE